MKKLIIHYDMMPSDAEKHLIDTGAGYILEVNDDKIMFLNEIGKYILFHCNELSIENMASNIREMITDVENADSIETDIEQFIETLIEQNLAHYHM